MKTEQSLIDAIRTNLGKLVYVTSTFPIRANFSGMLDLAWDGILVTSPGVELHFHSDDCKSIKMLKNGVLQFTL